MRTVEEYLSIKLDLLWYDAMRQEESFRLRLFPIMGDLMKDRYGWKKLSELHTEPITNSDYSIKNQIRDLEWKGCYFGIGGIDYRDNEPLGTNFNQSIIVTRKEYNGFYSKLFPYRLIQVTKDDRWPHKNRIGAYERLNDFLEFHLKEHFNNDFKSYKSFLISLEAGAADLVRDFMGSIKLWIENHAIDKNDKVDNTNKKLEPLSIAYAIWFLRNGTGLTETQTIPETVTDFLQKYDGEHSTIVKYVSRVSKFTSTDHNQKQQLIKEALRLLDKYHPNGRKGRDWWSKNKARLLDER